MRPATTNQIRPASIAAPNAYHLPKKPISGGIPISENMKIVRIIAIPILVFDKPERSSIFSTGPVPMRICRMQAKRPMTVTT